MAVLRTQGTVKVNKVSVMFGHVAGVGGATAVVDVEIYDGATFNAGGTVTLGNLLYVHSQATNTSIQISTHAINELDVSNQNIVSTTGTVVVGWRMEINSANGNCAGGYSANFATDNSSPACFGACPRGNNILDERTNGPVDPAAFALMGVPLCSCFYAGNWIIRACVEPQTSIQVSGTPSPGFLLNYNLIAPNDPGGSYFVALSSSATTGFPLPNGLQFPLDPDLTFQCFLSSCRGLLVNGFGNLNAQGRAGGALIIPNDPVLVNSCFPLYFAFFTGAPGNITQIMNVSPASPRFEIK